MIQTLFISALLLGTPVEDGSLLFVANGNTVIQNHTKSTLTHVGVILEIDNEIWFYDAIPPKVRKVKLNVYLEELKKLNKTSKYKKIPLKVWIAKPDKTLNKQQKEALKEYLESQIDRTYSLTSYFSQQPTSGIHCCELTGEACNRSGILFSENPCADSPIDVWNKSKEFFTMQEIDLD